MLLGSFGLSGCGKKAEEGYTPQAETTQTTLVGAQTPSPVSALDSIAPVSETAQSVKADTAIDYLSPLVTLRADPYLCKDPNTGKYYFTGSYPEYDRIELRSADTVNGIATAQPKIIWLRENTGINHVWAPEMHYVMGQWVIYYAASENPQNAWEIKCRALRCKGNDPMNDEWEKVGPIEPADGDTQAFQIGMSLDMTVYENKGRWYAIWAEKPNSSNLYLAELATPFKLKTKPIMITTPEYWWEKGGGQNVDEGPAVLKHAGKIYVTFSGSATDENYCMGMLEINEDADQLDLGNWKKYDEPVFQSDPSLGIYGPGHNSFVKGDNDEWLCIVHFRDYPGFNTSNSLYDHNRHAHVMRIKFDEDGKPVFSLSADELYNTPYEN
ncbi:MAG: family 43 glycosylhydrolase, partial [Clostridiales bacterium]|nr:family 43 glycosylhydrolase [Clostridiales bacterium]